MFQEAWWALYKTAILGVDRSKLDKFVADAEHAILERCKLNGEVPTDERQALTDALSALGVVKREQLRAERAESFRK